MADIYQDSNRSNTYPMRFRCKNCLHEFEAAVWRGTIAEDHNGKCPNCDVRSSWLEPLRDSGVQNLFNKEFASGILNQLVDRLRGVTRGHVTIEIQDSDNAGNPSAQRFVITCTGGKLVAPVIRYAASWPELFQKVEEVKSIFQPELKVAVTDDKDKGFLNKGSSEEASLGEGSQNTGFSLEAMNQLAADLYEIVGNPLFVELISYKSRDTHRQHFQLIGFDDHGMYADTWEELLKKVEEVKARFK